MVANEVKENIRAVLLSKTDGSGILVSAFLRDYKTIIHKPLLYKDMGYTNLEAMIKDIPDVCRLEYSEKDMAYKLYGISKPNTFVSSFVKKAEGSSTRGKQSKANLDDVKGERFTPSSDLSEKWEPSTRGLFSLVFNCKKTHLDEEEEIVNKFSEVGTVAEVNILPAGLAFVRFRNEQEAKRAVELWGDEIGVKRAEERMGEKRGPGDRGRRSGNKGSDPSNRRGDNRNQGGAYFNKSNNNNRNFAKQEVIQLAGSDCDWESELEQEPLPVQPGSYKGATAVTQNERRGNVEHSNNWQGKAAYEGGNNMGLSKGHINGRRTEAEEIRTRPAPNLHSPAPHNTGTSSVKQVYVGNWPKEASKEELEQLVSKYKHSQVHMYTDKKSIDKKYAFVDCLSLEEAERMVLDLNDYIFHNRNLLVRLGNRSAKQVLEAQKESGGVASDQESTVSQKAINKHPPSQPNNFRDVRGRRGQGRPPTSPAGSVGKSGRSEQLEDSGFIADEMPPLEELCISPKMPSLVGVSPTNQMPWLEQNTLNGYPHDMPPTELASPIKGAMGKKGQQEGIRLFISNFPYGTSKDELWYLFERFSVLDIVIVNQSVMHRSTYAYVTLRDMEVAMQAIMALDQSMFKGRKLTVALPPEYLPITEQSTETLAPTRNNMDNPTGLPHMHSHGSHKSGTNYTHRAPGGYPGGSEPHSSNHRDQHHYQYQKREQNAEINYRPANYTQNDSEHDQSYQYNRGSEMENYSRKDNQHDQSLQQNNRLVTQNDFNFQRLTNKFREFTRIIIKMSAEHNEYMQVGMRMKLHVTHVENEKFFWAQLLQDNMFTGQAQVQLLVQHID
ncbi:hypothetical protein MAR_024701 [Mya arenaria]|uniref:Uncharacterized protein n=1 Tax=Mya arenaria TaxID=6604 RepID=A0ABY7DTX4_MYAAR|nr:hypothetical protein MAR_024701 [Mya arenaria]